MDSIKRILPGPVYIYQYQYAWSTNIYIYIYERHMDSWCTLQYINAVTITRKKTFHGLFVITSWYLNGLDLSELILHIYLIRKHLKFDNDIREKVVLYCDAISLRSNVDYWCNIYIIITKISAISSETEGPGASFMTRTLQLRFSDFGAPIIYMIPVPLLT